MSINDDEAWTCDRCGSTAVVSRNAQPEGWRGVLSISPPKAEAQGHRLHMCPECVDNLDTWWMQPDHHPVSKPSDAGSAS